jgi:hypothetical protein
MPGIDESRKAFFAAADRAGRMRGERPRSATISRTAQKRTGHASGPAEGV